jgi:hypothetical protein
MGPILGWLWVACQSGDSRSSSHLSDVNRSRKKMFKDSFKFLSL